MLSYLGHQNTVLTSFLIQRSSIDPSLLISMLQKPSRFKVKVTRPPNVTVWKKPEISRTKNNELHVCYSYPQFWSDWARNVREYPKNFFVDTFLTGQGGGGVSPETFLHVNSYSLLRIHQGVYFTDNFSIHNQFYVIRLSIPVYSYRKHMHLGPVYSTFDYLAVSFMFITV